MDLSLLTECIRIINNPQARGYSYVQDFAEYLYASRESLNIQNVAVVLNVKYYPSDIGKLKFFPNGPQINLESIDTDALCSCEFPITSINPLFVNFRKGVDFANSHIIALPINQLQCKECDCLIRDGVILLFSHTAVIDISDEQLSILYILLNSRVPTTLSSDLYEEALNELTPNDNLDSFTPHYLSSLEKSLYRISNKLEYNPSKPGLRHFSLWNFDTNSLTLNKEFNLNTFSNISHNETFTSIDCKADHFLGDVLRENETGLQSGVHVLKVLPFFKVKPVVKDQQYFEKIGFTEDSSTLVIVSYSYGEENKIACLYIHRFPYSIFVSSQLICNFVRILCDYIIYENTSLQNKVFNQLIDDAFESDTESDFYIKAADILKSVNEAADCLVFMFNERNKLLLKNQTDSERIPQSYTRSSLLTKQYEDDVQFKQWFEGKLSSDSGVGCHEYTSKTGSIVKSAQLVPVKVKSRRIMGYILLINKGCTQSSESIFQNDIFLNNNYKLSIVCGMVLSQYQRLMESIHIRNHILKKIRHEIPSNTDAIKKGIDDIVAGIKEKPIREKYLLTTVRSIGLNISRIMLLTDFFTTVDFPKEKFAENRIRVNVYRFLNSHIDIFRSEGCFRGVDVYFIMEDPEMTITVSKYYQLAVVNIITNAVRYAAMGTSVVIEVAKDSITVSDIGIPIFDSDMEHIYEEGYRSKSAIRVNEKGMGYGLYLSKLILEAHNSSIFAQCNPCSEENVFAQQAIYEYIQSLPSQEEKNNFIYNGLESYEYPQSDKLMLRIANAKISPVYKKYSITKPDLVKNWLDYISNYNYVFVDMGYGTFSDSVYEVIFKISI